MDDRFSGSYHLTIGNRPFFSKKRPWFATGPYQCCSCFVLVLFLVRSHIVPGAFLVRSRYVLDVIFPKNRKLVNFIVFCTVCFHQPFWIFFGGLLSHFSFKSTNTKCEVKLINQIANLYTRELRINVRKKNVFGALDFFFGGLLSHYSLKSTNTKCEIKLANQILNLYTRKLRNNVQKKKWKVFRGFGFFLRTCEPVSIKKHKRKVRSKISKSDREFVHKKA